MSKEDRKQVQSGPKPWAESPPSHTASGDAPEKHKRDNEKVLLEMLDGGGFDLSKPVQLAALQRACMAVPNLTPLLTGDRRAKLYMRLLLDDKSQLEEIPESLASFAADATDDYRATAITLETLLAPISFEENEMVGFLCYLNSKRGFTFDEAGISLLNLVAVVLSDAKLSSGHTVLQLLFNFLQPLLKDFAIPLSSKPYDKTITLLLRLILQYHDPALSIHLDQSHISIGELLLCWVKQLFILRMEYREALGIIDYLLVLGDPALIPYVALAYIIANRQIFLDIHAPDGLRSALDTLEMGLPEVKEAALDPRLVDGRSFAPMPVWSGKTLLQNANLLHRNTPQSTRRVLGICLYPDMGNMNKTPEALEVYYSGMPCLPLERSDIASSFSIKSDDHAAAASIQYVIVDCRSQTSFEYARLSTAVFVGDVVSFDADRLQEMVERLMPAKGVHLSVFGTGRGIVEESNLLTIIVLYLVQRYFPYVSITAGGFKNIIALIRSNLIRITRADEEAKDGRAQAGKNILTTVSGLFSDAMSTTAVRSMLSGLGEMRQSLLPRTAAEADEVKGKTVQGFSAATAWGAGLMQKIQEKLSFESRPAAVDGAQSGTAAQSPQGASGLLQGRVLQRHPPQHIFTLGGDEDNDDLDLIVTIPACPVKGKVIATEGGEAPPPQPSPPPPEAADTEGAHNAQTDKKDEPPTSPLEPVVANIDKEFEQLFGEISTPVRDVPAQSDTKVDKKDLEDENDIFGDL